MIFAYFYQVNDPFWNILIKNQISAWEARRQGIAFAGWWTPLSETRGRLCCNVQIVWRGEGRTQFNTHIHRLAAGNTVSAPLLASYSIHNSARTACLEFRNAACSTRTGFAFLTKISHCAFGYAKMFSVQIKDYNFMFRVQVSSHPYFFFHLLPLAVLPFLYPLFFSPFFILSSILFL
jgi:hypothetical protein